VLNTYHGLSYREIATAMQIQVGTVGAALSQARANLARSLEETG
jgi:DNA-directed RNA polymerase specialized sigma24 family protein